MVMVVEAWNLCDDCCSHHAGYNCIVSYSGHRCYYHYYYDDDDDYYYYNYYYNYYYYCTTIAISVVSIIGIFRIGTLSVMIIICSTIISH